MHFCILSFSIVQGNTTCFMKAELVLVNLDDNTTIASSDNHNNCYMNYMNYMPPR